MAETRVFNQPVTVTGLFRPLGGVAGTAGAAAGASQIRVRATTAQVNAGLTLLPALSYGRYRLVDVTLIAIGGSAAGATSVRISATQAASGVHLITALVAALTQSTVVKPNSANVSVLADGASFVANDINTAVTLNANGTLTTATAIDVLLTYVVEVA